MKWAGAVIELDVARFSSPHTPVSFQHHYVSSHQRNLLPKKSVFGFWPANHSVCVRLWTTACTLVALSFLILAWSHRFFAGHTRSGVVCSQSELLSTSVVNGRGRKEHSERAIKMTLYSSHMPRNHDLPKSSCSLLHTCVRVVYPERNCSAADRSIKEFQ